MNILKWTIGMVNGAFPIIKDIKLTALSYKENYKITYWYVSKVLSFVITFEYMEMFQ